MRGLAVAVILTAGAGCDLVFGPAPGGSTAGIDASTPTDDGPGGDAGMMCPGGGEPTVSVTQASADAAIVMDSPNTPFGTETVANVGVDLRSHGLFRFPIRTDLGPPIQLEVTIRFAENQNHCGSPCASCLPLERGGTAVAHAAHNDWEEAEVTWVLRRTGFGWDAPGAESVGVDHSTVGVNQIHVPGEETVFTWKLVAAEDAWMTWRIAGELSFLVIPQGPTSLGTVMVSSTNEGAVNLCNPADEPAQLVALFCT